MTRSAEDRLQTYVALVDEIWRDVQPLIGSITLSALFSSALRHAASDHACLAPLKATTLGVDRESLRQVLAAVPADQATRALAELVRCLLTVFESVAGPIIVRQIMPQIMRAEREE